MRSYDINIFLVPFTRICDLLAIYDINFNWGEKDRETARDGWNKYLTLTSDQKYQIGAEMVSVVRDELEKLVLSILDDSLDREISRITIELHSNLGEVKSYEFETVGEAVEFLNTAELKGLFITSDSLSLFSRIPFNDEDDE